MKKIIVAIPHSHAWFWLQTCTSSLLRNPPRADGYEVEVVVVDNSPWSPAIRGLTDTDMLKHFAQRPLNLRVMDNHKPNKFHASALDCVVEKCQFDLLMAIETDVLALCPDWLQWFVDQLRPTDFAVGHWHHEQFVNPSCTLYRGEVLRTMAEWCRWRAPQDELRWGVDFSLSAPLDSNLPLSENPAEVLRNLKSWISGPFAEKRGWPTGTKLKESPSGQLKGPGWYEPGQQLHHWAVDNDLTYSVCPTTTLHKTAGFPVETTYGQNIRYGESLAFACAVDPESQVSYFSLNKQIWYTVHLWGGTRALDIIKHPVTCEFVKSNTPYWLEREARFWRAMVPLDVQEQTLELIRTWGWHYRGQGGDTVSARDREAAKYVQECYAKGGVEI